MLHLRHISQFGKTGVANVSVAVQSFIVKRGYLGAKKYDPDHKIDFEISKDPDEWKYVSRLLPLKMVPEPTIKTSYPSGWKPQNPDTFKGPYYVRRSRNHMIPVYLSVEERGLRKRTTVRHVLGDIWLFASDLVKHVESKYGKSVGYRIDEVGCKVVLRGDYHYWASEFLVDKGF